MAKETGLTARIPESFYEKPFVRRMLDPSTPTIEVDGEEASVETATMDGRLFPTIVKRELSDGSFGLVKLDVKEAYDEAVKTGNFIQFDSDEKADQQGGILSREAGALREAYKNNQNFLAQGGKGLGDVEFRADVEPYVGGDELTRLGLELYRRGVINLTALPLPQDERIDKGENKVIGNYQGLGGGIRPSKLSKPFVEYIREQNPLTKENIMQSRRIAAYTAGVSDGPETDPEKTFFRPRGESELAALHELRHGALEYLFNTTDLRDQKYFDNYDLDVEEDIMDLIDNRIIKERQIPMAVDKVSKLDPKYIGGRDRLETVTRYATEALDELNVPERAEQKRPSMLNRLLGMEQGGIMMAQQGQAVLPVTEATSAPQGGGPKAANPAAKPTLAPPPTKAPRPGSQDPRDEAMQEVAQELQANKAPQPAPPAPQPVQQPMQPVGGLAAPQQPPAVPMMAKGGTTDEKPEGLAVMIGLGAPTPSYEDAAEGNPPPGATKEEVADDQLVLLSEGELVVPANVVRYHGLGTYEGMRREALMGLQDMEQNGQIEYVSGGKEKADKIDDNGGIVKAQAGTYLAPPMGQGIANNPQFGINYAAPATYRPTTLVTPVAASSQFVKTPGQQTIPQVPSALGMTGGVRALNTTNPLLLPYTPIIPSSVTGVYAPNVGQYQTSIDSGAQPETPEVPTVPTPTTPTPPPQDEGGGDRDLSPEAIAAQAERDEQIEDRKDAAAQLGYTNQVGILEGLASAFGYGTPEIGTVMADGTIADGKGNTFDPITGKQVGFKGGIVGNIAGNLGLMSPEMPAEMAANIPASSYAGVKSLAGEQSIANVLAEAGTPAQTIEDLGVVAPNPGMMSPTVDELSTPPMDSAIAAPTVTAPTVGYDFDAAIGAYNAALGTFDDGAFSASQLADIASGATSVTGLGVPNMAYDYSKSTNPAIAEQEQLAAAAVLNSMDLPTAINPVTGAPIATPTRSPVRAGTVGQEMAGLGLSATPSGAFSPDNVSGASIGPGAFGTPSSSMNSASLAEAAEARRSSYDARVNERIAEIEATGKSSSYAANKAKADIQAQDQTGNPNAQAVTTEDGKAVTSTNPDGTKSVVTSSNPGGSTGGSKSNQGPSFDDSSLGKGSSGGSVDSQTQGPSFDDSSLGKDSGSSESKIVCTEMYRQTQLDDWAKAIKIWDIYQKKYLTPLHEVGYHWLFKPYVHGMKRSGILTAVGAFLAKKRTQHLRHILTKGKAKDSFVGNVWCKIIHPIVYLVGKMVYKK